MSMDVTAIAESMGMDAKQAEAYLMACDEAIISDEFMATRQGNKVHLAIRLHGLGGRMVLSQCREILARWHQDSPVLLAPVRHGNERWLHHRKCPPLAQSSDQISDNFNSCMRLTTPGLG